MPCALRGQKRVLHPMEAQMQMLVRCCVCAGSQSRILCKSDQYSLTAEPCLQPPNGNFYFMLSFLLTVGLGEKPGGLSCFTLTVSSNFVN